MLPSSNALDHDTEGHYCLATVVIDIILIQALKAQRKYLLYVQALLLCFQYHSKL